MESEINMQEEKQEAGRVIRVVEEEEDDDDGPPPGFQCIITPQPQPPQAEKAEVDDDEDEGPPPGFHSIAPKPSPLLPSSDMGSSIQEDIEDEEDGPPPGWEFVSLANALPKPSSNTAVLTLDISDAKMESSGKLGEGEGESEGEDEGEGEGEDEGPPPGWETVLSHHMASPSTPPVQPSSTVFSDMEKGKQEITRNDDEVPQSVSQFTSMAGQSSPPTPKLQQSPSSASPEAGNKGKTKDGDKGPKSERQSASPKQPLQPASHPLTPAAAPSSAKKAQLVCGTCRKLLLYPQGAKLVQCPGCQEVNCVLEAHEVGQVKCGDCGVLLMYPHGAPAVQCTSCRFVNKIGAHNRRPPLSVQQAGRRRSNRGRGSAR